MAAQADLSAATPAGLTRRNALQLRLQVFIADKAKAVIGAQDFALLITECAAQDDLIHFAVLQRRRWAQHQAADANLSNLAGHWRTIEQQLHQLAALVAQLGVIQQAVELHFNARARRQAPGRLRYLAENGQVLVGQGIQTTAQVSGSIQAWQWVFCWHAIEVHKRATGIQRLATQGQAVNVTNHAEIVA